MKSSIYENSPRLNPWRNISDNTDLNKHIEKQWLHLVQMQMGRPCNPYKDYKGYKVVKTSFNHIKNYCGIITFRMSLDRSTMKFSGLFTIGSLCCPIWIIEHMVPMKTRGLNDTISNVATLVQPLQRDRSQRNSSFFETIKLGNYMM